MITTINEFRKYKITESSNYISSKDFEILHDAHDKELYKKIKNGSDIYNQNSSTGPNWTSSRTALGRLTSIMNPTTKKIKHNWEYRD